MSITPYSVVSVYSNWCYALAETKIGENAKLGITQSVATMPAAVMLPLGMPTLEQDLDGNETAVLHTTQIEIYANGQRAATDAYKYDEVSHKAMVAMGFKRTYGPEFKSNADNSIKRLLSRYTAVAVDSDM